MIKVGWFVVRSSRRTAQIWRVLDLSGMTNSVRESRNFARAGFMYLNGSRITSLKKAIGLGEMFTLELRFPNGVTKTREIMLVPIDRTRQVEQRSNEPRQLNYRGNSRVQL